MKRFPELDGFRGFLAIMVMLIHAGVQPIYWLNIGMDCFFSMSAFLITSGLLAAEDYGLPRGLLLKDFFIRRTARIFPMYYAMLAGIALLFIAISLAPASMGLQQYSLTRLIPYVFYLQYHELYGLADEMTIWLEQIRFIYHTWSLAVEEQFYVVWGLLFVLVRGNRPRFVLAALFIIIGVTTRASGLAMWPLLPYRLDAFGYGISIALIYRMLSQAEQTDRFASLLRICTAIFLSALVIFLFATDVFGDVAGWWRGVPIAEFDWSPISVLTSAGGAALVGCLAFGVGALPLRPFQTRVMRYLGSISYAIYLIHYPVVDVMLLVKHAPLTAGEPMSIAITAAVVLTLAHFATKVFNRVNKWLIVTAMRGQKVPPPKNAAVPAASTAAAQTESS